MYCLSKSRNNFLLHVSVDHGTSTFYPNIAIQISKLVDNMFKKNPPSWIEKRILGTYYGHFKILCQDEKEQVWHLAEGAETCRVLTLWALQMKHTRFSRKKNASRRRLPSQDYLRPRDLDLSGMDEEFVPGFSIRKPYAIAERGFSLNKRTREKGIQAQ